MESSSKEVLMGWNRPLGLTLERDDDDDTNIRTNVLTVLSNSWA
jgi:hypothetical protein